MGHAAQLGWGLSVVLSVAATAATSALVACGPVPDGPGANAVARAEEDKSSEEDKNEAAPAEEAPTAAPAAAESATVPLHAFPTLGALCVAQRAMFVSRLARIVEARRDLAPALADDPLPSPSCVVDTEVLARTRVHLTGPYLELSAIRVETGAAFATHLVVRTAAGWQALPTPELSDVHEDPGCPSILRDGPPVEILVAGGEPRSLVIVGEASRGAGEEVDPAHEDRVLFRYATLTRVRACRPAAEGAAFGCTEPQVVEQRLSVSGGREPRTTIGFSTTYRVDLLGQVIVASAPPPGVVGVELQDALR